jgi:hypothetical protein
MEERHKETEEKKLKKISALKAAEDKLLTFQPTMYVIYLI